MLIKSAKHFLTALIILMVSALSACTTYTPQKAPCDQYGAHCGPKIKINQW